MGYIPVDTYMLYVLRSIYSLSCEFIINTLVLLHANKLTGVTGADRARPLGCDPNTRTVRIRDWCLY